MNVTMVLHRDVAESRCGGQVADGKELFGKDYWCVYCGATFNAVKRPPITNTHGPGRFNPEP